MRHNRDRNVAVAAHAAATAAVTVIAAAAIVGATIVVTVVTEVEVEVDTEIAAAVTMAAGGMGARTAITSGHCTYRLVGDSFSGRVDFTTRLLRALQAAQRTLAVPLRGRSGTEHLLL